MFALKRNQVIITALVVMIAVAGYLNYADKNEATQVSSEVPERMVLDGNGDISALISYDENGQEVVENHLYSDIEDALAVSENPSIATEDYAVETTANDSNDVGEAVFVNTSSDSSYFVQAKLEREQARSRQKDILMGMINDAELDKEKKAVCADAMLEIQKRIEKETAAEAMIESKGFKEVYVRIDDTTVDVVINKEALSDAEIAQIEDIVKRKTGMEASQIRISAMKP